MIGDISMAISILTLMIFLLMIFQVMFIRMVFSMRMVVMPGGIEGMMMVGNKVMHQHTCVGKYQ
jgi:hypothetical protein